MSKQMWPEKNHKDYDNLLAPGEMRYEKDGAMVAAGEKFKRGALLGRETASGQLKLVDPKKTDGTEKLYAIAIEDVDNSASTDPVPTTVYYTGGFNTRVLSVREGDKAENHVVRARKIGIFFKGVVHSAENASIDMEGYYTDDGEETRQ